MTFDYGSAQKRARGLIKRYNEQPFQVKRKSSENQMVGGEVVISPYQLIDIVGVSAVVGKNLINNTTILQGDLLLTMQDVIEPLMSDVFVVDGQDYEVIAIEKYKPSVTVLAYKVQLRT